MPVIRNIRYPKLTQLDAECLRKLKGEKRALTIELGGRSLDFAPLERLSELSHLAIVGPGTVINWESIPHSVEDLSILNLSIGSYMEISRLRRLHILDHRFGEVKSMDGIQMLHEIQAIQLLGVKIPHEFQGFEKLSNLQWLKLSHLRELREMPDISHCSRLVRIVLENCHGLVSIRKLRSWQWGRELIIGGKTQVPIADWTQLAEDLPGLRMLPGVGALGSEEFQQLASKLGKRVIAGYYGTPQEFVTIELANVVTKCS